MIGADLDDTDLIGLLKMLKRIERKLDIALNVVAINVSPDSLRTSAQMDPCSICGEAYRPMPTRFGNIPHCSCPIP